MECSETAIRTMLAIPATFQRSLSFVVGLVRDYFASRRIILSVPSSRTLCPAVAGYEAVARRIRHVGCANADANTHCV